MTKRDRNRILRAALRSYIEAETLKPQTKLNPWYVVRSDDKPLARIETIKLILHLIPYKGRSRTLDFQPNKQIIIPGDQELKLMRREYRATGACER
jgi:hypothetical protein